MESVNIYNLSSCQTQYILDYRKHEETLLSLENTIDTVRHQLEKFQCTLIKSYLGLKIYNPTGMGI